MHVLVIESDASLGNFLTDLLADEGHTDNRVPPLRPSASLRSAR
jgi:hypothetical protein